MRWHRVRRALLAGSVWLACWSGGQAQLPGLAPGPGLGLESSYLETFKSASVTPQPGSSGNAYRVYHLEFSDDASAKKFSHPELKVFNRSGRFVDLFAPPTDEVLQVVAEAPGIRWLDYNRTIRLPVVPQPKAVPPTRSSKETVARSSVAGYTGQGVILAIVDSGFDVRHPDFQTVGADGRPRTRFRALWDTTGTPQGLGTASPITYPNGEPIGVVYSRADIDAYLATPESSRPDILWDGNGHGTSCAGIAAGNGRALEGEPYAGVASQADLIGVRVGDNAQNTFLTPALLAWIDEQAGATPLVISNSWGSQRAGRDGNSLIERQINDRFPADRAGRVVLFAAGNEGEDGLHSAAEYAGKEQPAILKLPTVGAEDDVEITVYFDSADSSLTSDPAIEGTAFVHGLTEQIVLQFQLKPGLESIKIFSKDGKSGRFDAYISGQIGDEKAFFDPSVARYDGLVNNPGTAENVLTVGSYDFNPFFEHDGQLLTLGVGSEMTPMTVGDISGYSSPGLTRLGRLKPDFVAPGQWWTAAAPLIESDDLAYDSSGSYNLFNGTSAATPYAAGVAALLLEKNPNLTLNQMRALLDRHLKADSFTGRVPNATWGRGKLTLRAVEAMLNEP